MVIRKGIRRNETNFVRYLIHMLRTTLQMQTFKFSMQVSSIPALVSVTVFASDQHLNYLKDLLPEDAVYNNLRTLINLCIVFHTVQSYSRFMSGLTLMYQLLGDLHETVSLLVTFSTHTKGIDPVKKKGFQQTLIRLCSLMFALCAAELESGAGPANVLNYNLIDPEGLDGHTLRLVRDAKDRPVCVYQRLLDLMMDGFSNGVIGAPAPLFTRCFQELGNAMIKYHECLKFKDAPFPFPFMVITDTLLMVYTVSTPFFIAKWSNTVIGAGIYTFLAVFCVWLLHCVADDLDNPFGYDSEDLKAGKMTLYLNHQLLALLEHTNAPVPGLSVGSSEDNLETAPRCIYSLLTDLKGRSESTGSSNASPLVLEKEQDGPQPAGKQMGQPAEASRKNTQTRDDPRKEPRKEDPIVPRSAESQDERRTVQPKPPLKEKPKSDNQLPEVRKTLEEIDHLGERTAVRKDSLLHEDRQTVPPEASCKIVQAQEELSSVHQCEEGCQTDRQMALPAISEDQRTDQLQEDCNADHQMAQSATQFHDDRTKMLLFEERKPDTQGVPPAVSFHEGLKKAELYEERASQNRLQEVSRTTRQAATVGECNEACKNMQPREERRNDPQSSEECKTDQQLLTSGIEFHGDRKERSIDIQQCEEHKGDRQISQPSEFHSPRSMIEGTPDKRKDIADVLQVHWGDPARKLDNQSSQSGSTPLLSETQLSSGGAGPSATSHITVQPSEAVSQGTVQVQGLQNTNRKQRWVRYSAGNGGGDANDFNDRFVLEACQPEEVALAATDKINRDQLESRSLLPGRDVILPVNATAVPVAASGDKSSLSELDAVPTYDLV